MHNLALSISLTITLALALAGCGGGGGGDAGTGVFLGAPVSGLQYETPTRQGLTDDEGRFAYGPGETVTFRVGGTVLGSAPGKPVITPLDLTGAKALTKNRDLQELYGDLSIVSPEATFVNLIVFLQTIDADDDLENGIRIPERVRELLDGVQLDFSRPVPAFYENAPFRRMLRDGLQAGLWGGAARPIRLPGPALDHFLPQAGIAPRFERPVFVAYDEDGDDVFESRYFATYDDVALRMDWEGHHDADEIVDERGFQQLTAHGRHALMGQDENDDGVLDSRSVLDYDDHEDQLGQSYFDGGALQYERRLILDGLGLPHTAETDDDGDGTVDRRDRYFRDAQGMVSRTERDTDADGTIDAITIYTYNGDGQRLTRDEDDDADGVVDRRRRYVYDGRGRLRLSEIDDDADGAIDRRTVITYDDAQGLVLTEEDEDADGDIDEIRRALLDDQGRERLVEVDQDADGNIDRRIRTTRQGNVEVIESDFDADGTVDRRRRTTYSADGNETRTEYDDDGDGTFEEIQVTEYERGPAVFLSPGGQV